MLHTVLLASFVLSAAPPESTVEIMLPRVANNVGDRSYPQSKAFTRNGIPLWNHDLDDAHAYGWPAHYSRVGHSMFLSIPKTLELPQGSWVRFHCADNGPCDLAVFVYECYPCKSGTTGLGAYLLGMDEPFVRTRCAPHFTVRDGGARQRMTAYVKTVERNKHVVLTLPGKAKYIMFGISNGNGTPCPDLAEDRCINTLNHCLWKNDRCEYNTCTQKGPGGCPIDTCADDEVAKAQAAVR